MKRYARMITIAVTLAVLITLLVGTGVVLAHRAPGKPPVNLHKPPKYICIVFTDGSSQCYRIHKKPEPTPTIVPKPTPASSPSPVHLLN